MTDSGTPRPGSAREKLLQYERQQSGRKSNITRFALMVLVLGVLSVALKFLLSAGGADGWRRLPERAAELANSGKLDGLRSMLHESFTLSWEPLDAEPEDPDAPRRLDRDRFMFLLRTWKDSGRGFASNVVDLGEREGGAREIGFMANFVRGDLRNPATVPLVNTWYVRALVADTGRGKWVIASVRVRECLAAGQ